MKIIPTCRKTKQQGTDYQELSHVLERGMSHCILYVSQVLDRTVFGLKALKQNLSHQTCGAFL